SSAVPAAPWPSARRRAAVHSAAGSGLATTSRNPAARSASCSSRSGEAVCAIAGVSRPRSRNSASSCAPLPSGSRASNSHSAWAHAVAASIAPAMSQARSTSAGSARVAASRNARLVGSSSTSRILGFILASLRCGYARPMPARILTLLLLALCAWPVQARTATARIASLEVAGVRFERLVVRLHWPAGAAQGELSIAADRIAAPGLGPEYRQVRWRCPLRGDGAGDWRCAGPLQGRGGAPMRLEVDLSPAYTDARLSQGEARLRLRRNAATPDATRLDLACVPVSWARSLLARAWPRAQPGAGVADGTIQVHAPVRRPLRVEGTLEVGGLALETTDAAVAMAGLDGRVAFEWGLPGAAGMRLAANRVGHDGQVLVGHTYLALSGVPVRVAVEVRRLPGGGWRLPRLALHDGDTLQAEADAVLAADGALQRLSLQARSARLAGLPARYLSGWLGLAGLSGLELAGAADATVRVAEGALEALDAGLH